MPRAGGQYVYLREAFSPLCGFLYGWTLFLVIQTGTIAAVGVAFAQFLGVLCQPGTEKSLARAYLPQCPPGKAVPFFPTRFTIWSAARGGRPAVAHEPARPGVRQERCKTSSPSPRCWRCSADRGRLDGRLGPLMPSPTTSRSARRHHANVRRSRRCFALPVPAVAVVMIVSGAVVGTLLRRTPGTTSPSSPERSRSRGRTLPWSLFLGTFLVSLLYLSPTSPIWPPCPCMAILTAGPLTSRHRVCRPETARHGGTRKLLARPRRGADGRRPSWFRRSAAPTA